MSPSRFLCFVFPLLLSSLDQSASSVDFDQSEAVSSRRLRRIRRDLNESDASQLKEAVKNLEEEMKKIVDKNKDLTEKVKEQEGELRILQYTNDEMMTRLEEMEGANFRLTSANKVLNSTVKLVDDRIGAFKLEVEALEDDGVVAKTELKNLLNVTEKLKADLGILQKKQRFSKVRIDGLAESRKKINSKLEDIDTKDEILESKITESSKEIQNLHSTATATEAKLNDVENFIHGAEATLGILEAGVGSLEDSKDQLFNKLGTLETSKLAMETKLKEAIELTKELQTEIWKIENWKLENINRTMHSKIWNLQLKMEDNRGQVDGKLAELKNSDQRIARSVLLVTNAIPDLKELIAELKLSVSKVTQCQIGYVNNPTDPLSSYGNSGQEIGIAFEKPFKDKPVVKLSLTAISGFNSGDGWSFIGGRGREVLGIRGTDHSTIGGPSVVTKDGFRVTIRASKAGIEGKIDSLYMMYVACGILA